MNTPLITDEKNPKWVLLSIILSSRGVKQEMSKQGISPMGVRITEERRTEEICKIGRDSGSEGYLPIFEHNHGFSQKNSSVCMYFWQG
ncbi:MAG TPA: hypothetical protein ENI32_02110 [Candidatus Syntrophoarchaeum butanivorans]|uniref:Uncharacterized protein n=1 Tax=Candidatus Syntropharchaeum butanivorans TaxID=1839936 RepID=A0A7J2S1T0_9EURY|nr:hypothetical protein [Candidatus Syntrophoarchaeum butanivorans]